MVPTATPIPTPSRRGDDRGQTTVLVAVVVVLALLIALALGRLGGAAVDRARARTAADAAALAAVIDEPLGGGAGRRRADDLAERNGARVVSYRAEGTSVEVGVQVGDARATSRAERVAVTGDGRER